MRHLPVQALAAAALAAMALSCSRDVAPATYTEACAEAQRLQRPILVDFHTEW